MKTGTKVLTWSGVRGTAEYVKGGWVGVRDESGRVDEWQSWQVREVEGWAELVDLARRAG